MYVTLIHFQMKLLMTLTAMTGATSSNIALSGTCCGAAARGSVVLQHHCDVISSPPTPILACIDKDLGEQSCPGQCHWAVCGAP
jgi:hypothetical protein